MTTDEMAQILVLLVKQAGSAHHKYETEELKVHDENWAAWYADHLMLHGFEDVVEHETSVEELAGVLTELADAYTAEKPEADWPDYYARRLAERSWGTPPAAWRRSRARPDEPS